MLGYNYRMNEIQAAIGIQQLKKLSGFLDKRRENYQILEKELLELDEITLFNSTRDGFESSYYCLSILLKPSISDQRFELVKNLNEMGVGTSVYYPKAIPEFEYYKDKYGYSVGSYPNAALISNTSIALPVGPHLNGDDMQYIAKTLKSIIKTIKQ